MLRFAVCGLLFLTMRPVMASDPRNEFITVTVVGTLRTGIVSIGGETTGTTITAKGSNGNWTSGRMPNCVRRLKG